MSIVNPNEIDPIRKMFDAVKGKQIENIHLSNEVDLSLVREEQVKIDNELIEADTFADPNQTFTRFVMNNYLFAIMSESTPAEQMRELSDLLDGKGDPHGYISAQVKKYSEDGKRNQHSTTVSVQQFGVKQLKIASGLERLNTQLH